MPDIWCLIPVKTLRQAKQRLVPVLTPGERAGLARAMATDVIRAARSSTLFAGVAVVTPDDTVAALARSEGAHVIAEPSECGLNAALTFAARELGALGAASVLIVPADVPQVTAADLAAMVEGHGRGPAVTIACAASDGGSNALACTPPDAITFCFGENSFHAHCQAARTAGIEPDVLIRPLLARDIDRAADLDAFMRQPSETLSYVLLSGLGLDRSVAASRCSHDR